MSNLIPVYGNLLFGGSGTSTPVLPTGGGLKLLCDTILTPDKFLSATEQAGPYVGPAIPGATNKGSFRPVTSGDIADFVYNGTATSNGAGGGTTTIDSVLTMFGDDYFIGATLLMTSGTCSGQSKTITDFAQATGTLTHGAFTDQIDSGDTFTLTLAFATRDIHIEEIASGDAGAATFKWSHDGGTTWLGRNIPGSATWAGNLIIEAAAAADPPLIIQCGNGDLLCFSVATTLKYTRSTNMGLTWAAHTHIATASRIDDFIVLPSGRILIYQSHYVAYSDDDGYTWSPWTDTNLPSGASVLRTSVALMSSGQVIAACPASDATLTVSCFFSSDGGLTFNTTGVSIAAANANDAAIRELDNGDLLCVYMIDEAPGSSHFGIYAKQSTDHGITWSAEITIIAYSVAYWHPRIVQDINRDVLVMCKMDNADTSIVRFLSTDRGATWSAAATVKATGGQDLDYPAPVLVGGHEIICPYVSSNGNAYTIRAGMWIPYSTSSDACPCVVNAQPQQLACSVSVSWMGGGGVAADTWTIEAAYQYAMENIISDSPSKPWRSTQHNIYCSIVIDMGANERCYIDTVALFGCNVPTLYIQMNDTNSWGSPAIAEQVLFYTTTAGVIDSVDGNIIEDAALMVTYHDHQLAGLYFRPLDGTDFGKAWKIKDNIGSYIILDTTAAHSLAAGNTFGIFQDHVAMSFLNPGIYRYIRIYFDALQTPEGYYQLGTIVAGRLMTLVESHSYGFSEEHSYDIEMLKTPAGGLIPVGSGDRKRTWKLPWSSAVYAKDQMAAFLASARGRSIAMIPADGAVTDCVLVKQTGNFTAGGRALNRWSLSATFEEVL